MNDFIVETHALTKRFGSRVAVDGVDLRIPRGSAFGYLGPNGAGKTTLIRMLLGLTSASSGTMQLRGLPVPERRAEALARVGAIVEEPRFHPFLTGRENLEIVAAAREPAAHARIEGALDLVGLAARADERVKQYSLGMRQRLGIARALLGDPELLILDEPTNGLDPAGILEFRGLVRRLVGEGRTVVLSSHLLDEVEKICDAVAIVDRGRVVVARPDRRDPRRHAHGTRCCRRRGRGARAARSTRGRSDGGRTPRTFLRRSRSRRRRGPQPAARDGGHRRPPARALPGLARGAISRNHVPIGGSSMRLVRAEFLKLRKRRGLAAAATVLTLAPIVVGYVVLDGHARRRSGEVRARPGAFENLHGLDSNCSRRSASWRRSSSARPPERVIAAQASSGSSS